MGAGEDGLYLEGVSNAVPGSQLWVSLSPRCQPLLNTLSSTVGPEWPRAAGLRAGGGLRGVAWNLDLLTAPLPKLITSRWRQKNLKVCGLGFVDKPPTCWAGPLAALYLGLPDIMGMGQ